MSNHPSSSPRPFNMQYEIVSTHLAEQRSEAAALHRARQARNADGTGRQRPVPTVGRRVASIWTARLRFRAGAAQVHAK
ncbi:MAG: hypothetical protein ACRDGS_16060 [Chloroflexota bacterium]